MWGNPHVQCIFGGALNAWLAGALWGYLNGLRRMGVALSGEELCMRKPFGNRGCARRMLYRVNIEISCWLGDFETIGTLWEMDTRGNASAPSLHPPKAFYPRELRSAGARRMPDDVSKVKCIHSRSGLRISSRALRMACAEDDEHYHHATDFPFHSMPGGLPAHIAYEAIRL